MLHTTRFTALELSYTLEKCPWLIVHMTLRVLVEYSKLPVSILLCRQGAHGKKKMTQAFHFINYSKQKLLTQNISDGKIPPMYIQYIHVVSVHGIITCTKLPYLKWVSLFSIVVVAKVPTSHKWNHYTVDAINRFKVHYRRRKRRIDTCTCTCN